MKLLAFTMPLIAWTELIRTTYVVSAKKDYIYITYITAAAGVNFILKLILIPKYGAMGAVAGTIMAEVVILAIQGWFVRKEVPLGYFLKNCIFFFFLYLVCIIFVYG